MEKNVEGPKEMPKQEQLPWIRRVKPFLRRLHFALRYQETPESSVDKGLSALEKFANKKQ
jgi:hypothetical protein